MTTNLNQNIYPPETLMEIFNSSEITHLENIPEINENEITYIKVIGVIDESTKNNILSSILNSIINSPKNIIFDAEKLTYINCSGINMFLYIGNLIDLKINKIIFINLPSKIYNIFKIFGLHKVFIFHSTYEKTLIEHLNNSKMGFKSNTFPIDYLCETCNHITNITFPGRNFCFYCNSNFFVNDLGQIEN